MNAILRHSSTIAGSHFNNMKSIASITFRFYNEFFFKHAQSLTLQKELSSKYSKPSVWHAMLWNSSTVTQSNFNSINSIASISVRFSNELLSLIGKKSFFVERTLNLSSQVFSLMTVLISSGTSCEISRWASFRLHLFEMMNITTLMISHHWSIP